ncbi:SDR family oxidoreductase [Gordonia sp. NB41Y]|uniref:SDR family oxidoreductase n=1 Tax=Gordonia sp. NB41Y TaxID=875808 RepID=UPI0006B1D94E|nr:SDR family oxidoreductase [Gordonia sp. NB41Y]EMP15202.2 short-chain dehydrogenase [Gordonia sp. NB41Y]WLP89939.1 SDR family oxidoreductase [Gordonia sp. NB41Y]
MTRTRVLITGASSGLGMGLAHEFASRGATLALCARRTDRLDRLAEDLVASNPQTRVVTRTLDVNDHGAVFTTFNDLSTELGGLDRVVVNAGIGKGEALGTGGFEDNLATLETNLVAGLAQIEAAMAIFREQQEGHLVVMSSVSAFRGLRRAMTTYAASKAGLAMLAEGLRAELVNGRAGDIKVSTIYPGYIQTELNENVDAPFMVDAATGCRALAKAIEKEPDSAVVPAWPWAPIGAAMRHLPLPIVNKLT